VRRFTCMCLLLSCIISGCRFFANHCYLYLLCAQSFLTLAQTLDVLLWSTNVATCAHYLDRQVKAKPMGCAIEQMTAWYYYLVSVNAVPFHMLKGLKIYTRTAPPCLVSLERLHILCMPLGDIWAEACLLRKKSPCIVLLSRRSLHSCIQRATQL